MDVQTHENAPEETTESTEAADVVVTIDVEGVTDLAGLFKYSGMNDALRDALKVLVKNGASTQGLEMMAKRYNQLRTALQEILPADTDTWTAEVDPTNVTVDELYVSTVMLSRWADLIHQMPNFLIAQKVQTMQQVGATKAIESGTLRLPGMPPVGDTGEERPQTGQYL